MPCQACGRKHTFKRFFLARKFCFNFRNELAFVKSILLYNLRNHIENDSKSFVANAFLNSRHNYFPQRHMTWSNKMLTCIVHLKKLYQFKICTLFDFAIEAEATTYISIPLYEFNWSLHFKAYTKSNGTISRYSSF